MDEDELGDLMAGLLGPTPTATSSSLSTAYEPKPAPPHAVAPPQHPPAPRAEAPLSQQQPPAGAGWNPPPGAYAYQHQPTDYPSSPMDFPHHPAAHHHSAAQPHTLPPHAPTGYPQQGASYDANLPSGQVVQYPHAHPPPQPSMQHPVPHPHYAPPQDVAQQYVPPFPQDAAPHSGRMSTPHQHAAPAPARQQAPGAYGAPAHPAPLQPPGYQAEPPLRPQEPPHQHLALPQPQPPFPYELPIGSQPHQAHHPQPHHPPHQHPGPAEPVLQSQDPPRQRQGTAEQPAHHHVGSVEPAAEVAAEAPRKKGKTVPALLERKIAAVVALYPLGLELGMFAKAYYDFHAEHLKLKDGYYGPKGFVDKPTHSAHLFGSLSELVLASRSIVARLTSTGGLRVFAPDKVPADSKPPPGALEGLPAEAPAAGALAAAAPAKGAGAKAAGGGGEKEEDRRARLVAGVRAAMRNCPPEGVLGSQFKAFFLRETGETFDLKHSGFHKMVQVLHACADCCDYQQNENSGIVYRREGGGLGEGEVIFTTSMPDKAASKPKKKAAAAAPAAAAPAPPRAKGALPNSLDEKLERVVAAVLEQGLAVKGGLPLAQLETRFRNVIREPFNWQAVVGKIGGTDLPDIVNASRRVKLALIDGSLIVRLRDPPPYV